MFRKAQAAMEFLMTYGWAILVVLVVIGALAYFGVLSPSMLMPEKCTFGTGISCVDYSIGMMMGMWSYHEIVLQNGIGRDMKINRISASSEALGTGNLGCGCNTNNPGSNMPRTLKNGATDTFALLQADTPAGCKPPGAISVTACTPRDTGRDKNRYNVTIYYTWLDSPGIEHTIQGEILARKK